MLTFLTTSELGRYDSKGVVTLNGVLLENSNIIDFLEVVFYLGKSKEVKYLSSWVAFLKNNGFFQFMINPKILIADYKDNWFFLGHLEWKKNKLSILWGLIIKKYLFAQQFQLMIWKNWLKLKHCSWLDLVVGSSIFMFTLLHHYLFRCRINEQVN